MKRNYLSVTVAATVLSGAPSTVHAILTRGDLLAATRAAGTLVPGRSDRPNAVAGLVVHAAVSAFWAAVLAGADRVRPLGTTGGAAAGLLIGWLDLVVIGRRYPAIQALPRMPQLLDHAAFGAVVGTLLRNPAADR